MNSIKRWEAGQAGLLLEEVVRLSFQRCACPPSMRHEKPPRSLGALPVSRSSHDEFLIPLALDEAMWIGICSLDSAVPVSIWIASETDHQGVLNAVSGHPWHIDPHAHLTAAPVGACDGICMAHSTLPFCRQSSDPLALCCRRLRIDTAWNVADGMPALAQASAHLRLVDYAEFSVLTGKPAPNPMDPNTGYTGWRLP